MDLCDRGTLPVFPFAAESPICPVLLDEGGHGRNKQEQNLSHGQVEAEDNSPLRCCGWTAS